MSAPAVLAKARALGLMLSAAGGGLKLQGPEPPADLLAELRAHKAAVLDLLAGETESAPPPEPIKRPPSWWRDDRHEPALGTVCACCWRGRWWTRDRRGWCWTVCHPPDHLTPAEYTVRDTAPSKPQQREPT